jgi:SagB-type dehydrogenase family enzyme
MKIPAHESTWLSRLFHLNSEPWLNEEAYGAAYHQEFGNHPDAPRTPLPARPPQGVAALAVARHSVRSFALRPLPLATLGAVLRASYGIVELAPMPLGGAGRFLRRSVPSAGGLYPLELYVLTQRVEGAPDGVHHLDVLGEALEHLSLSDWRTAAAETFYTWPYIAEANAVVCFAAVFDRCQSKYGPRGYRYILLETGHAAQNLCLTAAEHGLSTLCMGGYRDGALNAMLGLTPEREGVVYSVALGWSAQDLPR